MTNRVRKLIDVDLDDIILRTFILFVQTGDAAMKYANANFHKKEGLSVIKFMVLRILSANGGTMTPSEIAGWTLRERHNITTLVDRLERDGLVKTERNAKDKRSVNITLTDKGQRVLTRGTPTAREIVNQIMASVTQDDAILLEKLLRTLRQNACNGLEYLAKHSHPQPG